MSSDITMHPRPSARVDLEAGLGSLMSDRRPSSNLSSAMRLQGSRVVAITPSPVAVFCTMLLLFMFLNSTQSPTILLWLGFSIFLLATCLRMFAIWQQIQAQLQVHGALSAGIGSPASNGGEIRIRVLPALGVTAQRRPHTIGLQFAMLDRELNPLDYDALRALDSNNPPGVYGMADVEIARLPTYTFRKGAAGQSGDAMTTMESMTASDSFIPGSKGDEAEDSKDTFKSAECTVCLEQLADGDLMRILPCLHQFHASCIDTWLIQQATCPMCKHRLATSNSPSFQH